MYPADPLNNGLESSGDRGKTDDHLGLSESSSDKKGLPAGRSQSFHEQSTSSREPHHTERGPSSPPEERGDVSSSAKKAGKLYIILIFFYGSAFGFFFCDFFLLW